MDSKWTVCKDLESSRKGHSQLLLALQLKGKQLEEGLKTIRRDVIEPPKRFNQADTRLRERHKYS
jgi:hypothetical protein